ncbi:MAG: MFS transporter [Opitutales bacterium]
MFLCGVAYSYGVAMPSIRADFDLTKAQASLPFSAILVSYTLGMWLGGITQDRVGPTRACLGGAVLFGGGFAMAGLMPGLWTLSLAYGLVCGFGIGVSYVAATATAVRWFPERRGLAAGCVVLGFGLGALLLAPLKQWLIAAHGWRMAFVGMGTCFLLGGTVLALLVRPPQEEIVLSDADGIVRAPSSLTTRGVLRTARFRLIWLAWALSMCAGLGWMAHLAAMAEGAGLSAAAAAWTLSAVAVTNGLSRPLAGALADKVGRLPTLIGAVALFSVVGLFMVLPMDGGWRFFVAGAFFGACFGTLLVNYSPVAAEFFGPRHLGSNLGLLYTSYGAGALSGPALFGWLHDRTGSYAAAVQLSIGLTLAALGLFYWAQQREAKRTAPPPSGDVTQAA